MSLPPLSFLFPRDDGIPDAVLLRRYVEQQDEAAFELLVRRHADLVWTVCRRTAGSHHTAEDAFQAAFLALAKRAGSVRDHLAGWLHRVAYHAALKTRSRPTQELTETPTPPEAGPHEDETRLIHAELVELPERYRLPLVLCDLEGLTHAEAAQQLGWPVGSVSGRLVRARERLKAKLVRRGITSAAVTLSVLPLNAASPLIPTTTAAATGGTLSPTVAALSEGALAAMSIVNFKLATVAAGILGVAGLVTVISVAQEPAPKAEPPKVAPALGAKPQANQLVADVKQMALSMERMKQILLACHNYHDAHGHFPADILDKNGKPLLSWRVAILPFIEQNALYSKFKLDEAWDSENNKPWSQVWIKSFTNGHEPKNVKYGMTFFQRPTGKGLIHDLSPKVVLGGDAGIGGAGAGPGEGASGAAGAGLGLAPAAKRGQIRMTDITDGTSNTIFLVEAAQAVEWAKPDDLTFDLKKPTALSGLFANSLHIALADGSARAIAGKLDAEGAKWMLGRDDGGVFNLDKYPDARRLTIVSDKTTEELKKELAERTAELKKSLEANMNLRLELVKLQTEREIKKQLDANPQLRGNLALASEILQLEELLRQQEQEKRNLKGAIEYTKNPPQPTKKK